MCCFLSCGNSWGSKNRCEFSLVFLVLAFMICSHNFVHHESNKVKSAK